MKIPHDVLVTFVEEYRRFFRYSLMEACQVLGLECQKKSRLKEAVQYFETFLYVAKQVGGKCEAEALGMLGTCLMNMGRFDKAMLHLKALADFAKQRGDKDDEAQACLHLGSCYSYLGQHKKAINYCERYIDFTKDSENETMKQCEGRAHLTIGNSYHALWQLEQAFGHYEASLNIAKEFEDKKLEGMAYGSLGHVHLRLANYEEALNHYEKSTAIAKEIGDKTDEVIASYCVGNCFFKLEQYEKAVDHLQACSKMAEQSGDNLTSAKANDVLGNCYLFGLDQYEKAEYHLKRAVLFDQELFDSVPMQDSYKVSSCEHFIGAYRTLALVFLLQNKVEEGLLVAEKGRSRALAELMTTNYSLQNSEATEARSLSLSEIREVVKLLDTPLVFFSLLEESDTGIIWSWTIKPNGEINHMPCGIVSEEATLSDALATQASLSVKGTNLMSLLDETRQMLKGRGSEEYEDRSLSFLYPDNPVRCASNRLNEDEKDQEKIQNYEEKQREALGRLYKIICPRLQERTGGSQVVIVSDGPVHLIPFAALIDENGHYLAESLQVRHVPSLATAKLIMEHRVDLKGGTSPLIVRDPAIPKRRLPCAKEEALMISKLLGVEPLIGENATKEKVLQSLEKAKLIHIAAHGDMERGEILLASNPGSKGEKEDYMLMLSDLEGKPLRASLVVLSCCHSAEGEVKADGVIGIARAFIGAGARSVLVALWAISDEGTLYFMKAFYQHFSRGLKASECLNKAMEVMRNSTKFCDPHFWAPFILIGDDVTLPS